MGKKKVTPAPRSQTTAPPKPARVEVSAPHRLISQHPAIQPRVASARIGAELFLGMVRSMNLFHNRDDRLEDLVEQLMSVFVAGAGRREP